MPRRIKSYNPARQMADTFLYRMLLARFKPSQPEDDTWSLTEKTELAVDRVEKFMKSYDVHYVCPTCTEKYIRKDYYKEDLVPFGRAYVAAIAYAIAVAQEGLEITSTSITTLGGPTGKELLSVQDKREAFEFIRVLAKRVEELTQVALNRFN